MIQFDKYFSKGLKPPTRKPWHLSEVLVVNFPQRPSLDRSFLAQIFQMYIVYMAGVQNSRSKGSYKVGPIGIEKLILHLRYEAGPIGNHAVPKLGASIALAWR